jgi:hypothetical protein
MTAALALHDPTVEFLPPPLRDAGKEIGIYGVEFIPIEARGAAGRLRASFKVEEDHAFLITQGAVFYTQAVTDAPVGVPAATPIPALVTMGMLDSEQRIIQPTVPGANDSPIDNWFGVGQEPCYWSVPKLLPPNAIFFVELTNLEAAARNYRLSFIGIRIYRARSIDPFSFCRKGW